ncbi:MAG TPA: hypothetical protein VF658_19285 [Pyrinomonadaceae bacterium]
MNSTSVAAGGNALNQTFPATPPLTPQLFTVVAPRFSLDPADIHSVFPPASSVGTFDQNLAHIVLTKRNLPWERFLSKGDHITPWMALLLFSPDEIIPPASMPPPTSTLTNPSRAGTYNLPDVLNPPTGTLGPSLTTESQDLLNQVTSITVTNSGSGYTSAPTVTSTGGGKDATAVAQIQNGVVVSLTLINGGTGYTSPPEISFNGGGGSGASASTQIVAPWVAHLVSLEGFAKYLVDNPTWGDGINRVRLVFLYSWNFTCLSESGDFRDLMMHLIQGQAEGGAGLLLHLPVTSAEQPAGSPAATVQQALGAGYNALSYETTIGDSTFAWYRGPFATAPRPLFPNIKTYTSAASAMIYDQNNALFDQSYAVAWQTGRLLALSDQSFGTKLLQWRRKGNSVVNLLAGRLNSKNVRALTNTPDISENSSETVAQLRSLLQPDFVSSTFMNHLLTNFSKKTAPRIAQSAAPRSMAEQSAGDVQSGPAAVTPHIEIIKRLYANPAVQQLLIETANGGQQNGTDPTLDYIVAWLAELRLLYGVPFVNLVPDARMLPQESLRFFFVDPNYLEALVAGALSIGIQSSRDSIFQSLMYPSLSTATQQAAQLVRSKLAARANQTVSVQQSTTSPQTPLAGFLLRSSVVSGWPGLEVRVYSDGFCFAAATDNGLASSER